MNLEEVKKAEYLLEVEATPESIKAALQYLYYMYGFEEYYTGLHIKGNKAYIEL